jgi:hypothetical protein
MNKKMSSTQVLALKPRTKANWDFIEPAFRFVILMVGVLILIFAIQKELLFNIKASTTRLEGGTLLNYLLLFSAIIFVFSLVFRTYLSFWSRPTTRERPFSKPSARLPRATIRPAN